MGHEIVEDRQMRTIAEALGRHLTDMMELDLSANITRILGKGQHGDGPAADHR